jgi:hypothetical protein
MPLKEIHNKIILDSMMHGTINESEKAKNIRIMMKVQEKLKGDSRSDGWLQIQDFTHIHNEVIKNLKNPDYIKKTRISATPTNEEFANMIAEDIAIFIRETTEYAWNATPNLKGNPKKIEEMNKFITHLLKKPELCNLPSSQIARDKHNRVGLLEENGNISNPAPKIFEAVKRYYDENLNGIRIPVSDLLIIRDTIELAWEVYFSSNKKPSRLRYNA